MTTEVNFQPKSVETEESIEITQANSTDVETAAVPKRVSEIKYLTQKAPRVRGRRSRNQSGEFRIREARRSTLERQAAETSRLCSEGRGNGPSVVPGRVKTPRQSIFCEFWGMVRYALIRDNEFRTILAIGRICPLRFSRVFTQSGPRKDYGGRAPLPAARGARGSRARVVWEERR